MSQSAVPDMSVNDKPALPNPEVRPKAQRRQFSAEYKRRIVNEADACADATERGALLRREGLYSSHLTTWRRQRDQGVLEGLRPKKRGPKPDPLAAENAHLRRQIERLQVQLHRAETIIEVQKKVAQLLGVPIDSTPPDEPR
jgi:transposase